MLTPSVGMAAVCSHKGGIKRISPGWRAAECGCVFGIGVGVEESFGKMSRVELDAPGGKLSWVTSDGG